MGRRRAKDATRHVGVERAFDEIAFGRGRTLNLRAHLPTRSEAMTRAESWLRERQVTVGGEVLVITGRGNASADGVSIVRAAVLELLTTLRHRHVVAGYREHTAGSFVVELAPTAALHATRGVTTPAGPPAPTPQTLAALDAATRTALRDLATIVMQHLGVHSPTRRLLEEEMLRQFATYAGGVVEGPDREARLRVAIEDAIAELEGG